MSGHCEVMVSLKRKIQPIPISKNIMEKNGVKVHTAYIAEVKRDCDLIRNLKQGNLLCV